MRRTPLQFVGIFTLLAFCGLDVRGESLLDQLPEDATAFVAANNVASASEKSERVLAIFKDLTRGPIPAPLAVAKGIAGIGPGLNEQGGALLALMPSDESPFPPQPLLLLPVSDYSQFASALGGDASGEICRVAIAGEEVLLAKRGDFAALMNVEHRNQFEKILAAKSVAPKELAPLAEWLATTDVSMGLTRSGVERLTALGRRRAADQRQLAAGAGGAESATLRQIEQHMQAIDFVLEFLDAEITAGAVGLTIDDQTNVKLAKRVLLADAGMLRSLAGAHSLSRAPLSRFASKPFVVAGGGPIPPGFGDALAALARRFTEQLPTGRGLEGFDADDWEKLEQAYRERFAGVSSTSLVLYAGEKEDGLLSNYFAISDVESSQQYLASFRKSIELDNQLMEKAENDLEMPYVLSDAKIDGKPAVLAIADVAGAADDPNVPGVSALMKALFGADGKLRLFAVAADETTGLVGSASEEKTSAAVEFAVSGKESLADESSVGAATQLLNPSAPWTLYLSPAGSVAWAGRGFQTWAGTFGGAFAIPPFPETPPVGVSANLTNGQLHSEMVMPVELLKGIADYAATLQAK